MRLTTLLLTACLLTPTLAQAVPQQLSQQGRLFDATGTALGGSHALTFRLFDTATGGTEVWSETVTAELTNGFYAVVLGADEEANALDELVLEQYPLWLELTVADGTPLTPRQALQSAPYAVLAGTAENLYGGTVDAGSVAVNGTPVIDGTGAWVGPTPPVGWADVTGIPADLADGDADTLVSLSCAPGQILRFEGPTGSWACDDETPSSDTLAALGCADRAVPVYTLATSSWGCGTDTDTNLTAAEVRAMVEGLAALDLPAATTLAGNALLGPAHAADPDAHHPADSSGLHIQPDSVTIGGSSTALTESSLDLGPASDDALTAAMVQTLAGGGNADALHSHVGTGGGGGGNQPTMISDEAPSTMRMGAAARYCRDLTEGGHDDWYLPSYSELAMTYMTTAHPVSDDESTNSLKLRWTQPQHNSPNAISASLDTLVPYNDEPHWLRNVRCVR